MPNFDNRVLDRLVPPNFNHVNRYSFAAVAPQTVSSVNKSLPLPWWHWSHDQGFEGSCVGHGVVMERAITNRLQNKFLGLVRPWVRRYDPLHVWNEAKAIDQWPDTNPGDDNGTSVSAGYDVARVQGLVPVKSMKLDVSGVPYPISPGELDSSAGVEVVRWATDVDEIRTAIASGLPVTIGVTWYSNFDNPVAKQHKLFGRWFDEYWIGEGSLGRVRGGHCVVLYGASDKREAFKMKNSWGRDYPLAWLPYETMEVLLADWGEAALVTDL